MARSARYKASLLNDVKEYGAMEAMKKFMKMRESWFEKGDKVLVGQDKYGNKYWECKGYTEHGKFKS